jgi:hypothetical protein
LVKFRSSRVEGLKSSVGGGVLRRVADSGGGVFVGGDFPGGWVGEKAADELGVEGMAGFAGFDAAEEREADEGEVTD